MPELPDAIFPVLKKDLGTLDKKITSSFYFNKFGPVIKKYGYRNSKKDVVFVAIEFERAVRCFYNSAEGWVQSIPNNLKPINLFNITTKPDDCNNIFIVNKESEAITKIEGWHGVSWAGGNNRTINLQDWKKLINVEHVMIWTDDKSARKIKTRIPHAKIIIDGNFKECANHLHVFDKKLKISELEIPPPDSFEFYEFFIHSIYGDENLEQRNGIFWRYKGEYHHWKQEEFKDIKTRFQLWFKKKRKDMGISLLDYVRSEGLAINKFMNNTLEFIARHATSEMDDNPFKDSAISPYIHLENGMIHISKKGKMTEWMERKNKNEDFFRKKYPVHCCDFSLDKKMLTNVSIEESPAFKYVLDGFIPKNLGNLPPIEKRRTYDFFSQVIAYSISPIKPTEYFFGLYGNEGTGKSFFVDIIKDVIGENFFLERPIDEMTVNNRFASSDFWGSKVYVEPDMKTNSILPEAFIKTFAGQKQITLEKKHNQPERGVNISIAMFFVSNFDFITKGMEGLARRVIYIPFKNSIDHPDRTLRDKIKGWEAKGVESGKFKGEQFDERPIILALAMKGWKEFLKNGSNFTMPQWIRTAKEDWIQKSDTVRGFIKENYFDKQVWYEIQRKDLFVKYTEWCKEEMDKHPYGKTKFYEEMDRMKYVIKKKKTGDNYYEFHPELKGVGDPLNLLGNNEIKNDDMPDSVENDENDEFPEGGK